MKGRKPKPTHLRAVQGNPGHRPIPEAPPLDKSMPDAPEHLSDTARAEWSRVAPQLHAAGLLAQLDRAALAAYCQAYGRWVDAETQLRKVGVLIKSPSGFPMASPFLTIANQSMAQMGRILTEFGMTPSARARVSGAAPAAPPDAGLEKWMRRA